MGDPRPDHEIKETITIIQYTRGEDNCIFFPLLAVICNCTLTVSLTMGVSLTRLERELESSKRGP